MNLLYDMNVAFFETVFGSERPEISAHPTFIKKYEEQCEQLGTQTNGKYKGDLITTDESIPENEIRFSNKKHKLFHTVTI